MVADGGPSFVTVEVNEFGFPVWEFPYHLEMWEFFMVWGEHGDGSSDPS